MAEPVLRLLSYAEYLEIEASSEDKHEFIDGVVYAMGGGSIAHALLGAAVGRALGNLYKGSTCRTHSSDQRIRIPDSGRAFYPDAVVTCGPIPVAPEDPHAIDDALVVVEVLSPTTERADRTLKLSEYRTLASIQCVLFVHADRAVIHRWYREESAGWGMTVHGPQDRVPLPGELWLSVAEVYEGIPLDPRVHRPL